MMRYNKFNEMRMTDDERQEYELQRAHAKQQADIAAINAERQSNIASSGYGLFKEKFIKHISELLEKDFKLSILEDKMTSISDYGVKLHIDFSLVGHDSNNRVKGVNIKLDNLDYYDINEFESNAYGDMELQISFSSKFGVERAPRIPLDQWDELEKDVKRFESYCNSIGLETKNDSYINTDEDPKHPGDLGYVKILVVAFKWYKFFEIFPDESNLPEDISDKILKLCQTNRIGKQGRIDIAKLIKDITDK